MTRSAIGNLLSAILLGAMLAASAPALADQVADSSVTSWVNEALRHDPLVLASEISVSTQEGVVTLTGRVHDSSQKSHATDVSGRVRGVRKVVNEIRVQPATGTIPQRSDASLANEIQDGLRSHWATSRVADRIRVGVDNGVATLTGDLDTWGERYEAGRVAFDIEGVWRVQNRLTVEGYEYDWEKWEYEAPYYYYEELFPNVA